MVQGGEDFCLALESRESLGHHTGERSRQHLDGDLALQVGVRGTVDLAHPPGAEGGEDLVRAEAPADGQVRGRQRADDSANGPENAGYLGGREGTSLREGVKCGGDERPETTDAPDRRAGLTPSGRAIHWEAWN